MYKICSALPPGSVYMVVAVSTLVGTPTGGALLKEVDQKHFTGLIVFSGVLTAAGTVILAMAGLVGSERLRIILHWRSASVLETDGAALTGSTEPHAIDDV